MLHIIILNKNYFPTKLNNVKPSDKVIILASPDGSIPVAAYKDEQLKNMEVKLIPDIKDTSSTEGKNALRIAQAMLIGQITAPIKEFEIYTDDKMLEKALVPFTGKKVSTKKKTSAKIAPSTEEIKDAPAEKKASKQNAAKKPTTKVIDTKGAEAKEVKTASKPAKKETADAKTKGGAKELPEKKTSKVAKAEVKTKPAKLPTQAEVKRVLGAANSSYAKPIMEVIKKSNQITFEMDLRMKLVEAGMDANQCKDLAKTINEEFGKMLPASM